MLEIFLNLVVFISVILCASYYIIHTGDTSGNKIPCNNDDEPLSPSHSWLPVLGEKFAAAYNLEEEEEEDDDDDRNGQGLFEPCDEENNTIIRDADVRCLALKMDVYDKHTGKLIQRSGKRRHALPNIECIPRTCGFGSLTFDQKTSEWKCSCKAPDYFGGEHCDQPQYKLTRENKCSKVADARDLDNYNIATFNPVMGGVCVECSVSGGVPILDSYKPRCIEINADVDEVKGASFPIKTDHCFYDALNPHSNNSPINKFIEGYGCSCDYYNGFVEAFVPGIANNGATTQLTSNACIKVGESSEYHTADLAYYCFKNKLNPIQVHTYSRAESPFDIIFKGREILVLQPANSNVDKNDWLNRNVKPTSTQPIRRLNYPVDDWPIVNKVHLVNQYKRRKETYPVPAYKLNVGRGFETKHWYEITNKRWLSNTIWGHPIIYGQLKKHNAWKGKTTLNPVGVKEGWYYGITVKTKPGEIVRMDTRGYNKGGKIVTIPPNIMTDILDGYDPPYLAFRFLNYRFKPY